MKYTMYEFINNIRIDAAKRRRLAYTIAVLSMFVAGVVSWNLHLKGVAISNVPCCGMEEHTHTEECGEEKVLICRLEEAEEHIHDESCYDTAITFLCGFNEGDPVTIHTHTEECYTLMPVFSCGDENHEHNEGCMQLQNVLACTMPETEPHHHSDSCGTSAESVLICTAGEQGHTHTDDCYEITYTNCELKAHTHDLSCYSDPNAGIETAEDWLATIPQPLTGYWEKDIVTVAVSQLGYTENDDNFEVDKADGITRHGITRYGQWFGNPYGYCNSMFVSFCLDMAGVPGMPDEMDIYIGGANGMAVRWLEKGLFVTENPAKGDIVFTDRDFDGQCDDIAIIVDIIPEEGLSVIGFDGEIKQIAPRIIPTIIDPEQPPTEVILGFGSISKALDLAVSMELAEYPPEEEEPDDGLFPEECPEGYMYYEAVCGEGIYAEAYAPEEAFTEEVTLFASVYAADSEEHMATVQKMLESGYTEDEGSFMTVELHFANAQGLEIEPNKDAGKVYVRFMAEAEEQPEQDPEDEVQFELIHADGTVESYEEIKARLENAAEQGEDRAEELSEETAEIQNPEAPMLMMAAAYTEEPVYDEYYNEEYIAEEYVEDGFAEEPAMFGAVAPASVAVFHITNDGAVMPVAGGMSPTGAASELRDTVMAEFTVTEFSSFAVYRNNVKQGNDYTDLQKAIDAAQSGDTIVITQGGNVGSGITIPSNKNNITIDLNGKEIKWDAKNVTINNTSYKDNRNCLVVKGQLTIKDSVGNGKLTGSTNAGSALIQVQSGASLTLESGELTGNTNNYGCDASPIGNCRGGAIQLIGDEKNKRFATFTMNGGKITNCAVNYAVSIADGQDGSGGAIESSYGIVNINGGTISGNRAENMGGAIYLADSSEIYMTGGEICNNKTYSDSKTRYFYVDTNGNSLPSTSPQKVDNTQRAAEGGGIALGYGGKVKGIITGGSIHDNATNTIYDWGGGGIFVANGSELEIKNAVIYNNSAQGFGGGVASCPTGYTNLSSISGSAAYSNTAQGTKYAQRSTKLSDRTAIQKWTNSRIKTFQDFYSPNGAMISGSMMGGGSQNWNMISIDPKTGNVTQYPNQLTKGQSQNFGDDYQVGMTSGATQSDINLANAVPNKVLIYNNSSATHGGGILNNGKLTIGYEEESTSNYELKFTKDTQGYDDKGSILSKQGFKFELYMLTKNGTYQLVTNKLESDANGDVVAEIKAEHVQDFINPKQEVTFKVVEIPDSRFWIISDPTVYYFKAEFEVNKKTQSPSSGYVVIVYELQATKAEWYKENADKSLTKLSSAPGFMNQTQGTVAVTKTVKDMPSDTTSFKFTATVLTPGTNPAPYANKDIEIEINGTKTTKTTDATGKFEFDLKQNETATITKLPVNGTITLEESTAGFITKWDISKTGDTNDTTNQTKADIIIKTAQKDVTCENIPAVTLAETGGVGTAPFYITGTALLIFAMAITLKKRKEN